MTMIEAIGTLVIICLAIVCATVYACVYRVTEKDVRMHRLLLGLAEHEEREDDQYEGWEDEQEMLPRRIVPVDAQADAGALADEQA